MKNKISNILFMQFPQNYAVFNFL